MGITGAVAGGVTDTGGTLKLRGTGFPTFETCGVKRRVKCAIIPLPDTPPPVPAGAGVGEGGGVGAGVGIGGRSVADFMNLPIIPLTLLYAL